ncbi:MAG TPA: sigma-70 family RNA polymerase sigma factor [Acidobacteriaceae bacterium]|nr:sigma-70 family RNA polymerase sigma factor [Acidobacteriaceae bacterium]
MNWEDAIPAIALAHAAPSVGNAEPAMDSDQFAAFYERTSRPLWAYLARTSGDPALADDLMQESYIRFLGAGFPGGGDVASRSYLFRIGTNLLRDHWRRKRTVPLEDLPPDRSAARDLTGHTESRLTLMPALAKLRPRDRQLLWLAHAENYSHREIAEITGLAAPSIRLLLFRARRQMAKLLQQEGAKIS